MSFPIPSDATATNQKDGRMSQGWYTFLYNLWRPLRNLLKIEDGRVLFMDGDTVNGAIVGDGLNLNRETNTLTATAGSGTPFPEAPQDGAIYGRQNAAWTQVISGGGMPTLPSPPLYSVQFNDPLGTFKGSSDLLYIPAQKWLRTGEANGLLTPFLIGPAAISTADGNSVELRAGAATGAGFDGGNVTIRGGAAGIGSTDTGGDVLIESGVQVGGGGRAGNVRITTPHATQSVGNLDGTIVLQTGNSVFNNTSDIFIGTGSITSGSVNDECGDIIIQGGAAAGDPTLPAGGGGSIFITGGNGYGPGGSVTITTGNSQSGDFFAGTFSVTTGQSEDFNGGDVAFLLGDCLGSNRGGTFGIQAGDSSAGVGGDISLQVGAGPAGLGRIFLIGPIFAGNMAAGTATPYFIPSGSSFDVPGNIQSLFTVPIEVDGTLNVSGQLLEVS